ncbi:ferredoxin [Clostridium sp. 19966]|uniref:ferredoxin n=1 Tax=Clostridium sp. 19966 TaxID=2768166 RepID=UPI0028DE8992|nr:ferredoxin [Clostridium sp. 19966]MDT8718801.1 ferredoxin [Clostridium sp. 19966]
MKAYVDKDACIGCGLCESVCSEVFFMDDDGKAQAVEAEILASKVSEVQDAASSCPVGAITAE